jgi:hypothetical protein
MIFTDYYKAQKLTDAESRFDITASTCSYDLFESLLINKRRFNIGGLSFNYGDRPQAFNGNSNRLSEKALTKGNSNISSVFIPSAKNHLIGYGDIHTTNDALILLFSNDYKTIEVLIARGYKNDCMALYQQFIADEFEHEIEALKSKSIQVLKENL